MLQRAPGFDGGHNVGHVLFANFVAQREVQVREGAVCGDLGDEGEGWGEVEREGIEMEDDGRMKKEVEKRRLTLHHSNQGLGWMLSGEEGWH